MLAGRAQAKIATQIHSRPVDGERRINETSSPPCRINPLKPAFAVLLPLVPSAR